MKPWIRTFSGIDLDPLDVKESDIQIEDIAHALALCNRFAGHTRRPISVAQHSVYVARLCAQILPGLALQGLLHDAAEAYLGDMTKWVKAADELAKFRQIEDLLQATIYKKFKCLLLVSAAVEDADRIMVRFEGMKGFGSFKIDHPDYPPLTKEQIARIGEWGHWSWQESERQFLIHFRMFSDKG